MRKKQGCGGLVKFIYMAIFGLVGVFSRYATNVGISKYSTLSFPVSTFLINIVGSFFIPVVYLLSIQSRISQDLRIGLMVGLLGGFTTFSAYSLETLTLFESGNFKVGFIYFVLSPLAGLVSAWVGFQLTQKILGM
jgi:fluoride exporter